MLAKTWKEQTEAPDWKKLYERAEDYPLHRVPAGGLFLTAGVDVQEDRLEIMISAWGQRRQMWMVDYIIVEGSVRQQAPVKRPDGSLLPSVWDRLSEILKMSWSYEPNGIRMSLAILAIDCGWATQEVYRWARIHGPGKVMVVRGVDGEGQNTILGTPKAVEVSFAGKKIPRGTKYWPVSSSQGKHELHGRLRLEKPVLDTEEPFPPGYCHFQRLNSEFFKQLHQRAVGDARRSPRLPQEHLGQARPQ